MLDDDALSTTNYTYNPAEKKIHPNASAIKLDNVKDALEKSKPILRLCMKSGEQLKPATNILHDLRNNVLDKIDVVRNENVFINLHTAQEMSKALNPTCTYKQEKTIQEEFKEGKNVKEKEILISIYQALNIKL